MEMEKYERTELEVIVFQSDDIIASSSLREQDEVGEMMP